MNIQSAGGQVAATIYGQHLPYIKLCKYQGDLLKPNRNEKDGICLYVKPENDPDYEIESIQPFSSHLNITLKEKRSVMGVEIRGLDRLKRKTKKATELISDAAWDATFELTELIQGAAELRLASSIKYGSGELSGSLKMRL